MGIDPGSRCTGYGIIWRKGSQQGHIAHGQIHLRDDDVSTRLYHLHQSLYDLITKHHPHEVAVESIFTHRNSQSALKLGQARGAVLVAAASQSLPVAEYSPRAVKQAVVGYGNADKNQVQTMIRTLLSLKEKPPSDAADALAIALCHSQHQRYNTKIQSAT